METHWIFLLDLLKRFLAKDMPLLVKMAMDSSSNQATKVSCVNIFPNVYLFELYMFVVFKTFSSLLICKVGALAN
jgi:hypothetical protein